MTYASIAKALIKAAQVKADSAVRTIGAEDEVSVYTKSAYDACFEACGDDRNLFQIVYMLYTGNTDQALAWAIVELKNNP